MWPFAKQQFWHLLVCGSVHCIAFEHLSNILVNFIQALVTAKHVMRWFLELHAGIQFDWWEWDYLPKFTFLLYVGQVLVIGRRVNHALLFLVTIPQTCADIQILVAAANSGAYHNWHIQKGGSGASGRVLSPVTGRSRVRVAVSSHCTGEGKACHWHPSPNPAQSGSSQHWVRPS